jgi:hypothetical protein
MFISFQIVIINKHLLKLFQNTLKATKNIFTKIKTLAAHFEHCMIRLEKRYKRGEQEKACLVKIKWNQLFCCDQNDSCLFSHSSSFTVWKEG